MNNEEIRKLAKTLTEDFYTSHNESVLSDMSKRNYDRLSLSKEKITQGLREKLKEYSIDGRDLNEAETEEILSFVVRNMWGYGIIDGLIHDRDVSDIKLYGPFAIRMKKKGKRYDTGITFSSESEYKTFVTRLLERNKVNLGTANAIQTFTDAAQEGFILRITVLSGFLCDTGLPCVAIRKIAKDKMTITDLVQAGMFDKKEHKSTAEGNDPKTRSELIECLVASKGILFTGKGASGKTTLMNTLLELIPHTESVMICQENSELFSKEHPDILAAHVMVNGGDTKVSYNLGDLTRAALLMDLDRVIVGEVKEGSEAAGLSKASMTGHKCWTSVHGESCAMAVEKMADYISQATGYKPADSLKQLTGFEYVVHLRQFNVDEVVRITGWDREREELILKKVYPFEEESHA